MNRRFGFAVCRLFLSVIWLVIGTGSVIAAEPIGFNSHIRPILSDKCFFCHGYDPKHREADLRLDLPEGAYAKRDSGIPIVPGNPDSSLVWERINSTDEDVMMPPPASHKTLSAAEKELIKQWIAQGAAYQKHWAFEAPATPAVPQVNPVMPNAIDAFISSRLTREGLSLSPEADRPTLIRRVSFSLTGLPPTPVEVDAFVADTAPDAYERMVDRYLASPRYGEEMARYWLDVARYADTHGLHLDNERQAWAFRDWVIKSFNDNQPFDQFTIDQLAGDQLPNPTRDQLTATGFNRCNVTTSEGGSIDAELVYRYAVDRTSTTMQTWMALTGGCAVCHDHKFDPISQKEFYSMYAFFNNAADPGFDGNILLTAPMIKFDTPQVRDKIAQLDVAIAAKTQEIDKLGADMAYVDPATIEPRGGVEQLDIVWLDDTFPAGAVVKNEPANSEIFVTAESGAPVLSGTKSLKRSDANFTQAFYESGAVLLDLLPEGKFFAYVYIDPKNPPKALVFRFNVGNWFHGALWGDPTAWEVGDLNTPSRMHMGPLPAAGQWARIEVPMQAVNIATLNSIVGFSVGQVGGTAYWDKVGLSANLDKGDAPQYSFMAWWRARVGRNTPDAPGDLNDVAKNGPDKSPSADATERLKKHYLQKVCILTKDKFAPLIADSATFRDQKKVLEDSIPGTTVFRDNEKPRESFVMMRGQYDKPADKVEPATLAILPPLKKEKPDGRATRLDLARWLVVPEHPLTARVTVNRFWQQFFGIGLVKTSSDFGSQGEPPTHPELLDWLATNYRSTGWNTKQLVRLMLSSATFRQSGKLTPALYTRDPENRLYARGPRFRLDAEQIRDNALFVSGLINLTSGGKGDRTYQPTNIWEPVAFRGSNTGKYTQDSGPALYRRSIYAFFKRTAPPPFMSNFDAPNREQSCTRRERTNTPLQALQLMNDVQHVEAARALATRAIVEGGSSPPERAAFLYRVVLSRQPEATELAVVEQQLAKHLARYQQDPASAQKLISLGQSKPTSVIAPPELASYTLVANMILNLDETLNRN